MCKYKIDLQVLVWQSMVWFDLAQVTDTDELQYMTMYTAFYKFLELFGLNAKILAFEAELCCVEISFISTVYTDMCC